MSDTLSVPSAQNVGDEAEQWIESIRQMNAQMQHDQHRIERAKIETDALRSESYRLKAETQSLRAVTRAALARLGEPV